MSSEVTTSIRKPRCRRGDGPASIGDVRRCQHGRLWKASRLTGWPPEAVWVRTGDHGWVRLHPWLNPRLYRKAKAAFDAPGEDTRP